MRTHLFPRRGHHPPHGYPTNSHLSSGCDGVVSIWDGDNKKRLFQIAQYPTSVAALAFDRSGAQLAVASSYTHEQGERDHPPDAIYVRRMLESEVKPKPRR